MFGLSVFAMLVLLLLAVRAASVGSEVVFVGRLAMRSPQPSRWPGGAEFHTATRDVVDRDLRARTAEAGSGLGSGSRAWDSEQKPNENRGI
jgi:hypothetical protein